MASSCKDNGMIKLKCLTKAVSKKHDFIEFKMCFLVNLIKEKIIQIVQTIFWLGYFEVQNFEVS